MTFSVPWTWRQVGRAARRPLGDLDSQSLWSSGPGIWPKLDRLWLHLPARGAGCPGSKASLPSSIFVFKPLVKDPWWLVESGKGICFFENLSKILLFKIFIYLFYLNCICCQREHEPGREAEGEAGFPLSWEPVGDSIPWLQDIPPKVGRFDRLMVFRRRSLKNSKGRERPSLDSHICLKADPPKGLLWSWISSRGVSPTRKVGSYLTGEDSRSLHPGKLGHKRSCHPSTLPRAHSSF